MLPSITLRGSDGPRRDPARRSTALLLRTGSEAGLIDAVRGVIHGLGEADVDFSRLTRIVLTHHHFDHFDDLYDVMLTTWLEGARGAPTQWRVRLTRHDWSMLCSRVCVTRTTHGAAWVSPLTEVGHGYIRTISALARLSVDKDGGPPPRRCLTDGLPTTTHHASQFSAPLGVLRLAVRSQWEGIRLQRRYRRLSRTAKASAGRGCVGDVLLRSNVATLPAHRIIPKGQHTSVTHHLSPR